MDKARSMQSVTVDVSLCRGCDMCTLACSLHHGGQCSPALARLRVSKAIDRYAFAIQICRHCDVPHCYDACPVEGAMERDERGVVYIVEENCIACGSCMEACPYEGIYLHEELDVYLKCDMCRGRIGGPICVETCPTGALSLPGDQGRDE
jgi:Fe-S-cluster-containing dehydrogenase component